MAVLVALQGAEHIRIDHATGTAGVTIDAVFCRRQTATTS
jgi:hypothetical protein